MGYNGDLGTILCKLHRTRCKKSVDCENDVPAKKKLKIK